MAITQNHPKKARFKASGKYFDNEEAGTNDKAKKKRPKAWKSAYIQSSLLFPNSFDEI